MKWNLSQTEICVMLYIRPSVCPTKRDRVCKTDGRNVSRSSMPSMAGLCQKYECPVCRSSPVIALSILLYIVVFSLPCNVVVKSQFYANNFIFHRRSDTFLDFSFSATGRRVRYFQHLILHSFSSPLSPVICPWRLMFFFIKIIWRKKCNEWGVTFISAISWINYCNNTIWV